MYTLLWGENAHLMGRGGDGGQKMLGTLENKHECSFPRVVEVTDGSIETH